MTIYSLKVKTLQMHWVMKIQEKLLRIHVDSDDKMPIDELLTVSKGGPNQTPLLKEAPNQGSLLKSTIKGLLST